MLPAVVGQGGATKLSYDGKLIVRFAAQQDSYTAFQPSVRLDPQFAALSTNGARAQDERIWDAAPVQQRFPRRGLHKTGKTSAKHAVHVEDCLAHLVGYVRAVGRVFKQVSSRFGAQKTRPVAKGNKLDR